VLMHRFLTSTPAALWFFVPYLLRCQIKLAQTASKVKQDRAYYLSGVFFDLFTPKNRAARDLLSHDLPGNFFGRQLVLENQNLSFQHELPAKNHFWRCFQHHFPANFVCWVTALTANGYIDSARAVQSAASCARARRI
jgi:hypothetical protein